MSKPNQDGHTFDDTIAEVRQVRLANEAYYRRHGHYSCEDCSCADNQASELEDIMLLVDRLDGGDPKHYMLQGKIKAAIEALLREARVDELNKMHESYEVTLSADLDFDPTVYKARRIAQLRKQSKKETRDEN